MDATHEDAERFPAEVPACRATTCGALGDTFAADLDTSTLAVPPIKTS